MPLSILAALCWVSSLPGAPLPHERSLLYWIPPSLQNLLHVPAYAVLAWAWRWALKRVFDIDIEHCLHCGGTLNIIAAPSTGSGQASKTVP